MNTVSKLFVGYLVAAGALLLALENDGTATTSHSGDPDMQATGGTGAVGGTSGTGGTSGSPGLGGTGGTSGSGATGGTAVGGGAG